MDYDPKQARELPQASMPDLETWLDNMRRFVVHMQSLVHTRLEAGILDADDAEEFETKLAVDPPLAAEALGDLESSLSCELPPPLKEFFLTASSGIGFHFAIDLGDAAPEGCPSWVRGGELPYLPDPIFSASKMNEFQADARQYAATSGLADFPEVQAVWDRCVPFFRFNNADFLALDPIDDARDPYVVHLNHEGDPQLVSRNLASFLIEWPRVCYIGPGQISDLERFFDPKHRVLSGDVPAAIALREALEWKP